MIKYRDEVREKLKFVRNPIADLGLTYTTFWNLFDGREVTMKTLLHLMEVWNCELEDIIYYEED